MRVGVPVGIFLAAFVFLESGLLVGALVAFVVLSAFYGVVMSRRMSRFWPAANELSADDRVALVRAARRGQDIPDARLAPAVVEYAEGLREARAQTRKYRWVAWLGAAAFLALAVVDCFLGPPRVTLVSWLFVAFFAIELFWWPKRQDQLLANAERAERSAVRSQ